MMTHRISLLLLFALATIAGPSAASMAYEDCSYVSERTLNFDPPQIHVIDLFDPDLGDLVRVDVNLSVNWSESISYHNRDSYAKDVNTTTDLNLFVQMPDGSDLGTNYTDLVLHNVSAYNGTNPLTFAPPEGFDYEQTAFTWATISFTDDEDLKAFTSGEDDDTMELSISTESIVKCDDRGNRAFSVLTSADSRLCVKYTYNASTTMASASGGSI